MTDDVTRGLGLLADEAEAAPIDTDAVIATANTRTRNRAILATAFVTILLVSALVLTLGTVKPEAPPIADGPDGKPSPPTLPLDVHKLQSPEEQARHRTSLHEMITDGFERILPDGWDHSTFDFGCDQSGCWAQGDILNSGGTVTLFIYVNGDYTLGGCYQPTCTKKLLDDGTLVAYSKETGVDTIPDGQLETNRNVSAVRPDGTSIDLLARWPASRTTPTLTDEQWMAFATVFTW